MFLKKTAPSERTRPSKNTMSSNNTKPSPFLQLPLEIRWMIYGLVLPYHDGTDLMDMYPMRIQYLFTPPGPKPWNKLRSIDMLATNQQIYSEAAPMLYANMRFKISIADHETILSSPTPEYHMVQDGALDLPKHAVFVRHCEIVMKFDPAPNPGSSQIIEEGEACMLEASNDVTTGIFASVNALRTLSSLKTLTFKLKCSRETRFKSTQEAVDFWTRILVPFDQLQVSQRWTVLIVNCWERSCRRDHHDCAEVEQLIQEHYTKNVRAIRV
ncbi:MAG: hypothetical protein L6R42_005863 [Xanthoria sp. 1 TBL-2021]|nr:MAG: hypothetical protein L6R42_005863 [Xanthoria sp. 1 TBL-2021]